MKNLKLRFSFLKKIGTCVLLTIGTISCDSTPDSVSGTTAMATFEFIYLKSPNAHLGNQCNIWNLKNEATAGAGFVAPTSIRSDNFAPALLAQTTMSYQSSAYDKLNKKYVVSSGERMAIYDFTTATVPAPTIYMVKNIQAMEFANGRFFVLKNNSLREIDINTGLVISSFGPIALLSGETSNMTYSGSFLYVISGANLYKIDTTGAGSIVAGYPISLTANKYEGLEYINTTACPNSLYVVRRTGVTNDFVKIDANSGAATTVLSAMTFPSDFSVLSSVLDYSTEFYYLDSSNGFSSGSNTLSIIDLTPTSGTITAVPLAPAANNYLFGLQLKD